MTTTAQYAGPERRWMRRELYDWTHRHEHHDNQWAKGEAKSVEILQKLSDKAAKVGRTEEADALWDGLYQLKLALEKRRERIAAKVGPWFDGSAFQ